MFCEVKPLLFCTINLSGVAQGFEGIASNQPRLRTKMRGYLTRGRVGSFRTIVASGCFVCTRSEFLIQIDVLRRREATFRGNWAAPAVDLVVGAVVVAVVGPVVGPVVWAVVGLHGRRAGRRADRRAGRRSSVVGSAPKLSCSLDRARQINQQNGNCHIISYISTL